MIMSLLNYTTTISVDKTASEIQRLLATAKAQAVLTEYSTEGILCAISFRIACPHGVMSFRLPANIDDFHKVLCREGKVPMRLRNKEQAARVAWRIMKDWIAAQLAIISAQMVTVDQAFLPYASLKEAGFKGLALGNG